jgi:hypothetical protein
MLQADHTAPGKPFDTLSFALCVAEACVCCTVLLSITVCGKSQYVFPDKL